MNTTTYLCYNCCRTHRMNFATRYRPFVRWLMSCPKCGKYTLHRLVELRNPGQSNTGPVFREAV